MYLAVSQQRRKRATHGRHSDAQGIRQSRSSPFFAVSHQVQHSLFEPRDMMLARHVPTHLTVDLSTIHGKCKLNVCGDVAPAIAQVMLLSRGRDATLAFRYAERTSGGASSEGSWGNLQHTLQGISAALRRAVAAR
jgi:hypothetical protein